MDEDMEAATPPVATRPMSPFLRDVTEHHIAAAAATAAAAHKKASHRPAPVVQVPGKIVVGFWVQ